MLALCRYVERNPVAAGMVGTAQEWPWSSYRAHVCVAATLPWLDSNGLHGYLPGLPVVGARDRQRAAQQYAALVANANGTESPFWQERLRQEGLRQQVFLGDEAFVSRMQTLAAPQNRRARCKGLAWHQDVGMHVHVVPNCASWSAASLR